MNDYIRVDFTIDPYDEIEIDILNSLLGDVGFESFNITENGVEAYIGAESFNTEIVEESLRGYDFNSRITWSQELIPGQDWNEEWEKNSFKPQIFENKCVVHSTDHEIKDKFEYDIAINPRMAFGTGHHETTTLMMHELLSTNLKGLNVLDMGTGTGILAILAAMRGAEKIVGIEIDAFAYDNAKSNVELNSVNNVEIIHGDASSLNDKLGKFDLFIANINRNIILNDIDKYVSVLKDNASILFSGFFENDAEIIENKASYFCFKTDYKKINNGWCLLKLSRFQRQNS